MEDTTTHTRKARITLLVNMIGPYRVPIYNALARRFTLSVLYTGNEDNRAVFSGSEKQLVVEHIKQSVGIVLKSRERASHRQTYDLHYLHLSPGLFFDLWKSQPDAVITNEMGIRTITALFYCAVTNKPCWVWWGGTVHTERAVGPLRRLLRLVMSRLVRHWISYGQSSTEYLTSIGVRRERILQIQNCVDERQFQQPVAPVFHLEPKPVMLHVGGLVGRKGVHLLMDTAAELQQEGLSFTLLLVGDGPEKISLKTRAAALGLRNVLFLGDVLHSEMPAVYRSSDLLVFPTLHDVWGLVVNEALWAGLPVLASKYAGCAIELLPPANVFDPLDPGEFRSKLRKALTEGVQTPTTSHLRPLAEVAQILIRDINDTLGITTQGL